ncbi:MAG: SprT-like domain-containing protein [bacterium]
MSAGAQLELPFGAGEESPEALRARVCARSRELVAAARAKWPERRIPEPRVEFGLRGRAAGDACPSTGVTRYNGDLLVRYGDVFVDRIVPHEVAHIVTWAVFGRVKPHGREWRAVMAFFGADPSVTHDFETVPARRVRRFRYRCSCSTQHLLVKRAHLRIRRGTAEYRCRRCGELLIQVEG